MPMGFSIDDLIGGQQSAALKQATQRSNGRGDSRSARSPAAARVSLPVSQHSAANNNNISHNLNNSSASSSCAASASSQHPAAPHQSLPQCPSPSTATAPHPHAKAQCQPQQLLMAVADSSRLSQGPHRASVASPSPVRPPHSEQHSVQQQVLLH